MYPRNRFWSVVSCQLSVVALVALVLLVALFTAAVTANARQTRNGEAQKLKNPEANNAETLEAGKKVYARHCASCHGPNGKGDGGMALSGGTPSDLTDDHWDYG